MENTLEIKTKKVIFGNGNEVKGWFKLTNGERTNFNINNDGEIIQSGEKTEYHPFLIGLYEMLFSQEQTMKNTQTPIPFKDMMVTFKRTDNNGNTHTIIKRGFYSNLFDVVMIPPEYRMFNGKLLPHGFGGDRLKLDKMISWKYCED